MTLEENELTISLAVECDHYRPGIHAPRITLFFDNGQDTRRMILQNNAFDSDPSGKIGIAYATYVYSMKNLFWDCTWQKCQMSIDVEYDGEAFKRVPMEVEFENPAMKEIMNFHGNYYEICCEQPIHAELPKAPNFLQTVLAVGLRLVNVILGMILLPWFCIDILGLMFLGTECQDDKLEGSTLKKYVTYVAWRFFSFNRNTRGRAGFKEDTYKLAYQMFSALHPHKKGILFLSTRRADLTGNFEYIYQYLKEDPKVKIRFWLHPEDFNQCSILHLFSLAWKAAASKVIMVDDFVPHLDTMQISEKTKVIQLWHACGAFKTFGFSRLGKKGGPVQTSITHRGYNYAFVSSKNIAKYYAEGFGLSEEKVLPYGVPRTDMFFDEKVKNEICNRLFAQYPKLQGKKVVLFAPTFRGNGKISAYYEKERFNPNQFIEALPEDYILLIKHHPFVSMKYKIDKKNADRIFDFSGESEINELLFITDVLITDYSSVIYEASLLNIPMLFYAYDLENYIASRDFYSGYEKFVPGKIVRTQEELCESIANEDYEQEKVQRFCEENFDIRDGKASERIAEFVRELALEQR